MSTERAGANAWLKEIGEQARTSTAKVFSVSVPLNIPEHRETPGRRCPGSRTVYRFRPYVS
ncbi:hypothetical protein M2163_000073 [Streptomyces sp. SAI-135]|jgi:hypothetical protein|nr:hypothetical protein [Streptomyces sp. SAI-090]MDH6555044.1 hypothetical protein [Streptomyces sp. SAI-041]MDH6574309.1 hypothetical protein [Streptomyces sp. SAI-117]MDH6580959.1 hypothetical protein [Streptomyces sp. SAI-133]MDH6612965.1 hypothetical protein [Streptomyces sp. SAI-135]